LRLKKILNQVSGNASKIDGELIPPVAIKGHGVIYCYSPSLRNYLKINRGTMVFIVEDENKDGKILIYTYEGHLVEIETCELMEIGFD